MQKQENKETMHTIGKIKKKDFSKRMEETNFSIQKHLDTETLEKFASAENLDWETASPLTRYESEAPPIILDNIIEDDKINCSNEKRHENSNMPSRQSYGKMDRS